MSENNQPHGHIKSRERVRDLGEVYTQPSEVAAMLDLIPNMFEGIDSRFLEPACGNGNFLVAILERKIAVIDESEHGGTDHWYEFALIRCLTSIYAIDISDENVHEARGRMRDLAKAAASFHHQDATPEFNAAVTAVIEGNVVIGDSLNNAADIVFVEYDALPNEKFARTLTHLETPDLDLFYIPPEPLPIVHYSKLGLAQK